VISHGWPPLRSTAARVFIIWLLRLVLGLGPAWVLLGSGLGVVTNLPVFSFHITRFSSSKVSYIVSPESGGALMTSTALAGPGAVASPRV
jgi:hypothetical protein